MKLNFSNSIFQNPSADRYRVFSLVTDFSEGTRENIFHIFRAQVIATFCKFSSFCLSFQKFFSITKTIFYPCWSEQFKKKKNYATTLLVLDIRVSKFSTVHAVCCSLQEKEVWNADFMRRAIISESDFENGLLFARRCRRNSFCPELSLLYLC